MMKNITKKPAKSLAADDSVPDSCDMVLLKDKYLKSFAQATNTLKAAASDK